MKNQIILCFLTICCTAATPACPQIEHSIESSDAQSLHVLNRLTFGPRPGDLERVKGMGVTCYIEEQLNPSSLPQAAEVSAYLQSHEDLSMTPAQLYLTYGRPVQAMVGGGVSNDPDSQRQLQRVVRENYGKVVDDFSGEHIVRAIYSPRQLEEVMTDFWFNHFNVSKDKGLGHVWAGSFEDLAIRPHALGKFRDLLGATAHHPAMLFYLDNWQNCVPGGEPLYQGQQTKPQGTGINENYARELMELHTLGVAAGYTQEDVIALARILTGLGIPSRRDYRQMSADTQITYVFNPRRHDPASKVFLGKKIAGSGEHEIEEALDLLASSPATANHISYKLVQYFIADDPPKTAVAACAQTFQRTGGDIKAVLRTLFQRHEFWDPQYRSAKFKSPQRYLTSALRASALLTEPGRPLFSFLLSTGQPIYGCLTPDGYKNTKDAWLNPDGLLKRVTLANEMSTGQMAGARGRAADPRRVVNAIGKGMEAKTRAAFAKAPEGMKSAVLLSSPEFMKY
ncbi:MAG: DUF1800 domain-containing protein [Candidatus Obscuribacterales bacterium]|nr:DUF1800 domain-containing protein [Candidatus Obscuribacterales bacterium]